MMGQVIKSGTGLCDILLDEDKLMKQISEGPEDAPELYETVDETNIHQLLATEEDEDDDGCALEDFKFSFE